ncbi:tRNA (guanosine(37)-N1)-methyltransferase TrmD, partial [Candidatus Peregrinibacteria bacterium]|nr:tRNA (guanosine(37)-N1)-methyltransferase TrmD [Candidatus Peregrinibacteria bacterium]
MRIDILTIFPKIFDSYFNESIIKIAQTKKLLELHIHDIREYTENKHGKVDDTPYGGGPGMVMSAQPIYDCLQKIKKNNSGPVIFLTPSGEMLTQNKVKKMSKLENFILLCGRYEG